MGTEIIHETEISSILSILKNGISTISSALKTDSQGPTRTIGRQSSIGKASQGLTLVFPVLISNSVPFEVATNIQKAIERKEVSMLQMLFSAYNITNAKDAISYLSLFHTNVGSKMDLDRFIDIMDSLSESAQLPRVPQSVLRAVYEDCKRNIDHTFEPEISNESLTSFVDVGRNGSVNIVHEYIKPEVPNYDPEKGRTVPGTHKMTDDDAERMYNSSPSISDDEKLNNYIKNRDSEIDKLNQIRRDMPTKMLLSSEVKKANELQPTLMVVNFFAQDKNSNLNVVQQAVAGVKAKLYSVDSSDIINKLVQKSASGDMLLKFVQLSSREISVIKDFLLGIDDAKLGAVTRSKKGSGANLFDALERRSTKGKIRRAVKMNDCYKAISTLVISEEEAQLIKKTSLLDCHSPRCISPIMEKLNLLHFIVVDLTSETLEILTDGDTTFETYSFSALSKESGDNSYKKIVNLITKLA